MRYLRPFLIIGLVAACSPVLAEDGKWLEREIDRARDGATIEIPAGYYEITDLEIRKDLTIIGPEDRSAVFLSAEPVAKGLLVPLRNVSLRVENITFRDANSWSKNGAGIRHEGRDLTVINCLFDNNEDGILSTSQPNSRIYIENSEFLNSGFGDGRSHALYVDEGDTLTVRNSTFRGTRIGHHIKSLARITIVEDSIMEDRHGRSSYAVDASRGGDLTVTGSTMIQAADNDNNTFINYDLTREGARPGTIKITGNTVINYDDNGGTFVRIAARVKPEMENNEIINKGKRKIKLTN